MVQVVRTAQPVMYSCGSKGIFFGVVVSHLDNYVGTSEHHF